MTDIDGLRMNQYYRNLTAVKSLLTNIPVRRPSHQEFVRVHPGNEYRLATLVLDYKRDRETFLIAPNLWKPLEKEITHKILYLAVNRDAEPFLWPIRMPDENGYLNPWSRSAQDAADIAQNHWVRIHSNKRRGAYDILQAEGSLSEPRWPELDFQAILNIAFKHRFIDTLDHPVLQTLRGAS